MNLVADVSFYFWETMWEDHRIWLLVAVGQNLSKIQNTQYSSMYFSSDIPTVSFNSGAS